MTLLDQLPPVAYLSDLCRFLGRTPKALRHLISRGKFPPGRIIGGRRCWLKEDVADFLAETEQRRTGPVPVKITTRPAPHNPARVQVDMTFNCPDPRSAKPKPLRLQKTAPKGMDLESAKIWGQENAGGFLHEVMQGKKKEESRDPTPSPQRNLKKNTKSKTLSEVFGLCQASHICKLEGATQTAWEEIWRNHVGPRFGGMPIHAIGRRELLDFIDDLREKKKLGAKRINSIMAKLRQLLHFALDKGIIDVVPHNKKEKEIDAAEKEAHTDVEIRKLMSAAKGRAKLALALGFEGGLRKGEILALRWGDVDLFRGEITVRHSMWRRKMKAPKGKKVVVLPMTPILKAALRSAYHTNHLPTDHVLPGPDGHRDMAPQTLVDIVKAAYGKAEIPYQGIHKMRHTYVSRLYECGCDLIELQMLARHASPRETQRYIHLRGRGLEKDKAAAAARARGLAKLALVNGSLDPVEEPQKTA